MITNGVWVSSMRVIELDLELDLNLDLDGVGYDPN